MSDERIATPAELAARLTELESRYLHLQRLTDELNSVVIDHARRIDELTRRLAAASDRLAVLGERAAEPRTLEEDKPPHY